MENKFYNIEKVLKKWENRGTRQLDNGTLLICNIPKVAPKAWLHRIYAPLTDNELNLMQNEIRQRLPADLKEFYSYSNGLNIFSNEFGVFGHRTSYVRIGDEAIQPFSLRDANRYLDRSFSNHLFIGFYTQDGSNVFYDLSKSDKRLFRCDNDKKILLNEWNDIWDWLESESKRVSALFDENGYMYNHITQITPEATIK